MTTPENDTPQPRDIALEMETPEQAADKQIERITTRPRPAGDAAQTQEA